MHFTFQLSVTKPWHTPSRISPPTPRPQLTRRRRCPASRLEAPVGGGLPSPGFWVPDRWSPNERLCVCAACRPHPHAQARSRCRRALGAERFPKQPRGGSRPCQFGPWGGSVQTAAPASASCCVLGKSTALREQPRETGGFEAGGRRRAGTTGMPGRRNAREL